MLTFTIDDAQLEKLQAWRRNHNCKYRTSDGRYDISTYLSSVGELEAFRFVPTSIGVVISTCECACGAKLDLTDFSSF